MKNVSMNQIASEAGVSVMTVSNVINGRGRVAESTARRVMLIAQEMGFRKDHFASLNASKRHSSANQRMTIAYNAKRLVDKGNDAIHLYHDIYFRIQEKLKHSGHHLVLTDYEEPGSELELRLADVIIEFDRIPSGAKSTYSSPRVCVFFESADCFCVLPDNEEVGRRAAALLAGKKNCKQVAICYNDGSVDQRARYDAFLRYSHVLMPEVRLESVKSEKTELPEVLDKIFHRSSENIPDLIFCLCGSYLMETSAFLIRNGISVPRDIDILGFDDFPFYEWLPFKVPRFYFDSIEIADAIVGAVKNISEGQRPVKTITPIYFKEH